mmetsp:Transcript_40904/g.65713  ORF Transcript_40904/g.65713 Transcript_40904/m.65713 type:complete len:237 (-) Transcript_40904:1675-2385(-)
MEAQDGRKRRVSGKSGGADGKDLGSDVAALALQLDKIEIRMEGLCSQLEDARKVEELERKMKLLSILEKIDEMDIKQNEMESRVLTGIDKQMFKCTEETNLLRKDVKLSFDKFRETVQGVIKQLQDNLRERIDSLQNTLEQQNHNYLSNHTRILVLEEESRSLEENMFQHAENHKSIYTQVQNIQAVQDEMHAEMRKLSKQVQLALGFFERAINAQPPLASRTQPQSFNFGNINSK